MTIKNKEGKIYVITGPNKLAKAQIVWDVRKLIFHNFSWPEIRSGISEKKTAPNKVKIHTEISEAPKESLVFPIEELEEIKVEIPPKIEEENKQDKLEFELPLIKYKVLMHCLPAEKKNYQDNLYGETWSKITYKQKFIFPAVIISNEDLFMSFWSSDPKQKITEGSIVYPFVYEVYNEQTESYNKVPYNEHRWWKIVEKETKDVGWIYKTIPSDSQPDFSD
jgi:hypothetical protein